MTDEPKCACPFERQQPPSFKRLLFTLLVLALFLLGLMWLGQ
jgi:hypothetical protein